MKRLLAILLLAQIACTVSTYPVANSTRPVPVYRDHHALYDRPAIIRPADIVSKKADYR